MDEPLGGEPPCWEHLLDDEGRLGGPTMPGVRVRRVYDPPKPDDGQRVLVDRLWPRGLSKGMASLDAWLREIAPSNELRRWYGHDPARWEAFAKRYLGELTEPIRQAQLAELRQRAERGPLTLLCAARDPARSNAEVVRRVLSAEC
jgi:uncharacterized protein YeaO (DUF488 family)